MSVLVSRLFTEGDKGVVQKLEDCAVGRPNEFRSHFSVTENSNGEHVRRVKLALQHAVANDPELAQKIPPFELNDHYDANFANAIEKYKQIRDIKNYANKYDKVVGIKTIQALDNEARRHHVGPPHPHPRKDHPVPRPPPRPLPASCMIDEEIPTSSVFEIQLIAGGSGGEIAEQGFFTFIMLDKQNRLSCAYTLDSRGGATPGLPVTPVGGGNPSPFETPKPTKITRFGPVGGLVGGTIGPPGAPLGPGNVTLISTLTFGWREQLSIMPSGLITINKFDTGPISIQGGGFQGGRFKCVNLCKGLLGADKI